MTINAENYYFPSSNGQSSVFVRRWLPQGKPCAMLMIAHGLAEHSGRYQEFAEYMANKGWLVTAHDHIGHGQSLNKGQRFGYLPGTNGWANAMADIDYLRKSLGREYPDLPCFMLGHSMSSFLMRNYLIDYAPTAFNGIILSGSGQLTTGILKLGILLTKVEEKRLGPQGLSPWLYWVIQGGYNRGFKPRRTAVDWLSSDPAMVDSYLADSFCRKLPTVSLYRHICAAFAYTIQPQNLRRMNLNVPVLLVSGGEDPVGHKGKSVQKLYRAFKKAGCRDVRLKLYPGCRHAILHEHNRMQVYRDIETWLGEFV